MKCPTCNAWTYNLETRTNKNGTVRRRYECANLHRFTTIEQVCDPASSTPPGLQTKGPVVNSSTSKKRAGNNRPKYGNTPKADYATFLNRATV